MPIKLPEETHASSDEEKQDYRKKNGSGIINEKNLTALTLIFLGMVFLFLDFFYLLWSFFYSQPLTLVSISNTCFWFPLLGGLILKKGIDLWKKPNISKSITDDEFEGLSEDNKDTVRTVGCIKFIFIIIGLILLSILGKAIWP